jgi:septin family protein
LKINLFVFREAILRTNVDALRERTHTVLYEAYRRDRLRELKMRDGDTGANMERACELVNFR